MSLLLDALHRASKDKEKAAAAIPLPVPPVESGELCLSEAVDAEVSFPSLHSEPVTVPRQDVMQELVLDPVPTLQLEPFAVVPPIPVPVPPVASATDATPAWEMAAVSAVVPPSTEKSDESPVLQPSSAPTPSTKPELVPAGTDRVAKEIRRAYAQGVAPSRSARRRVVILGGIAIALLLGFSSVFLGVWGDPSSLLSLGSRSSLVPLTPAPSVAAPAVASALPAVVDRAVQPPDDAVPSAGGGVMSMPKERSKLQAPVASVAIAAVATPSQNAASSPLPVPSAVTAVPASSGNEVVLRSASPKTGFVAKMAGPNLLEIGYAALLDGRFDDAARSYRQALSTNSEERDALLGLAYIAHQKGQREDAQAYYRRVLRQEPGNSIANAALLALDSDADTQASSLRAREMAGRQPDSAATMAMAGSALVRDGRLADAVQLFARAQFLEPDNPLHAYNHAVALDRLGQYGGAKLQYENVLKLSEKTPLPSRSAFSVEVVRQRLEQLGQALGSRAETDK